MSVCVWSVVWSIRTIIDGVFGGRCDHLQANDARVADVVVLVAALVVAGRVAHYAGARQQRRLTIGVIVAVELE